MSLQALVIDDSKAIRSILKKILLDSGFEVTEAGDGLEALNKLVDLGSADLALVDWNMPNMNGFEFLQNVRANSIHNDMKIMMVTTESELDRMIKALDAGANEYLMKPFSKEALLEKLNIMGLV